MSRCLEFEDKMVDTAVEKAARELNIPKDKLKYDVISYGSSGIFGLVGTKKARIRVTLPESGSNKPANKRKRRSGKPAPPACDELRSDSSDEQISQTVSSLVEETFQADDDPDPAPDAPTTPAVDEPPEADPQPPAEDPPSTTTAAAVPIDPGALLEIGKEALSRIVSHITTGAEVTARQGEDRLCFDIQGGESGILIGKKGQTLEAIQYLVEKMVNRHHPERVRVQVDVEGYLDNRRQRLEELADRLAQKAKRSGKPVTIGQLNAHDRRIVHISLKGDPDLRTQSMGEGFYRKLVIFPKKRGRKKQDE